LDSIPVDIDRSWNREHAFYAPPFISDGHILVLDEYVPPDKMRVLRKRSKQWASEARKAVGNVWQNGCSGNLQVYILGVLDRNDTAYLCSKSPDPIQVAVGAYRFRYFNAILKPDEFRILADDMKYHAYRVSKSVVSFLKNGKCMAILTHRIDIGVRSYLDPEEMRKHLAS